MLKDIVHYILFTSLILVSVGLLCNIVGLYGVSVGIDFGLIIIVIGTFLITKDHLK